MLNTQPQFFGSQPQEKIITELVDKCSSLFRDSKCSAAVVTEGGVDCTGFDAVCAPCGLEISGAKKLLTYSEGDINADLCALNVQHKESYVCFELMSAQHMGRVFVSNGLEITVGSVLVAAAVLCACGAPLEKVIEKFNSFLKKEQQI